MNLEFFKPSTNGHAATLPTPVSHNRWIWLWPAIIGGVVMLQLSMTTTLIVTASSNQSFAVEPNSYAKAAHWDDTAAQQRLNKQLAWSPTVEISPIAELPTMREVSLALSDRDGLALTGATVSVEAFPHARANERLQLPLTEISPANYSIRMPISRYGVWEFRFIVEHDGQKFTHRVVQEVN